MFPGSDTGVRARSVTVTYERGLRGGQETPRRKWGCVWDATSVTSVHVGSVLDAADEEYPVVFEDPERDAVVTAACNAPA
jgi:hypothetical protein